MLKLSFMSFSKSWSWKRKGRKREKLLVIRYVDGHFTSTEIPAFHSIYASSDKFSKILMFSVSQLH